MQNKNIIIIFYKTILLIGRVEATSLKIQIKLNKIYSL